jgi:ABC-type glycerol-3-phosphate transport system substrate-binding protein
LGLLYNRTLFTSAGLDPGRPPTTWAEVRAAANKIAALGDGTVGYGEYSKNNTGGAWKAAFNDGKGRQVLTQLRDMRWDRPPGARRAAGFGREIVPAA